MRRGYTLIEILVVISIIATLSGLTVHIVKTGQFEAKKLECQNNVRQLLSIIELGEGARFPHHNGSAVLHYFVLRGDLQGEDDLETLFCPGDLDASLRQAGGVEGLRALRQGDSFDHATSYAVRGFAEKGCRVSKGARGSVVLIADDSDDHHDGRGIIVGLSGGAVKWRSKFDRYGLAPEESIEIGTESAVEELRCLRE